MTIEFGNATDIGLVREENQDSIGKFPVDSVDISSPQGQLFIVADGMGGHRGGRVAGELAVESIQREYFSDSLDNIAERLERVFQQANTDIYEYSFSHPSYLGMGTTCTALALQDGRGYIAHLGDSRVYRVTKQSIEQLTEDHSTVAEMQRRGLLTSEEAKNHPQRSQLYRALGVRPSADVDVVRDIVLHGEEYFVLCTDGLYNYFDTKEIQKIVLANSPQNACEELVRLANERGGQDNITVQVIQIKGSRDE